MNTNRIEFQPSMVVCTPMRALPNEDAGLHLEPVSILWHRAMKLLLSPLGYNIGEILVDGLETGDARCLAVKEAVHRKMKYIMFIDADTILPQNGMQLLVYQLDNNPDYDIAAGLYTQKANPPVPLIWNSWGEGVYWDWTLGDVLKDGILAAGTGCMLIRVSLFERLVHTDESPWFQTLRGQGKGENADYQFEMSDDIYFCRRAVSEAKAKILIDTSCYCKHIDWKTGRLYQLRDDALPVCRAADRITKARSEKWLSSDEELTLRKLTLAAVERSDNPVVVEVGSFVGNSSRVIASALKARGTLYCVDTWEGTPGDVTDGMVNLIGGKDVMLSLFKRNVQAYLDSDTLVPVVGESVPSAAKLNEMDVKADLVFIDANHQECGKDIAAWLPLLKPDGVICGHDFCETFPLVMRDVRKAFDKIETVGTLWIRNMAA